MKQVQLLQWHPQYVNERSTLNIKHELWNLKHEEWNMQDETWKAKHELLNKNIKDEAFNMEDKGWQIWTMKPER